MKISREFNLYPHQVDFVTSKARYVVNSGGVGSGKTRSLVLKSLLLLAENPGITGLLGARTMPQLRNTTLAEFMEICPPEFIKTYNRTNYEITTRNGSLLLFRPLDDETKLKSLNLGFAGVEELSDNKEPVIRMIRTRLRQAGMPGQFFGATNSSTFENFVFRWFIDSTSSEYIPGAEVIFSSSADNLSLPPEYLADLETLKKTNPDYYDRMVLGKWGSLEGLVYSFPPDLLVDPGRLPQSFEAFFGGMDFGFSVPTALLVYGERGDSAFQVAEAYRYHLTGSDIVRLAVEYHQRFNFDQLYCDGARPEIIEELNRAGVPAIAGNKSREEGILHVKGMIGDRRLLISKDCTNTIREMGSYVWDQNALRRTGREVPVKANDHCMDAMRYALFSRRISRASSFEFVRIREK